MSWPKNEEQRAADPTLLTCDACENVWFDADATDTCPACFSHGVRPWLR